jgi:hypothetical protein
MTDRRVAGRSALLTRSDDRRPEPRLIYGAAHGYVIVGPSDFFSDEICPPSSFARDLPRQRGSGVTTWNAHGDGLLELRDPINQLAAAELPRGFGRD